MVRTRENQQQNASCLWQVNPCRQWHTLATVLFTNTIISEGAVGNLVTYIRNFKVVSLPPSWPQKFDAFIKGSCLPHPFPKVDCMKFGPTDWLLKCTPIPRSCNSPISSQVSSLLAAAGNVTAEPLPFWAKCWYMSRKKGQILLLTKFKDGMWSIREGQVWPPETRASTPSQGRGSIKSAKGTCRPSRKYLEEKNVSSSAVIVNYKRQRVLFICTSPMTESNSILMS